MVESSEKILKYIKQQIEKCDLCDVIGTYLDDSSMEIVISPFSLTGLNRKTLNFKNLKSQQQTILPKVYRSERKTLALAFDILFNILKVKSDRYKKLGDDSYLIAKKDIFYYAITGNQEQADKIIKKDPQKYQKLKDECDRDLLYITSKYGHYFCLKCLLSYGFLVNSQQSTNSTVLHASSFYGYENSVKLLLEFGASNSIKNQFNNYPSDEAASTSIKNIILSMDEDKISVILKQAMEKKIGYSITPLISNNKIIAKRIVKFYSEGEKQISALEKYKFLNTYEKCYHGTKFNNLISILNYGFLKPGSVTPDGKSINVHPNHFKLGKKYYDQDNWADAVFVSPSLLYSCDICYSEPVISNKKQWCCIIEARVKPDSYIKQQGTGSKKAYEPIDNEPKNNEYRVQGDQEIIFRINQEKDQLLYPTSILFVLKDFLENIENYDIWSKAGNDEKKCAELIKFNFEKELN